MQNGPKTMTSTHRPKSARRFTNRPKQWTSNGVRPDLRGPQNAQRSYERYLALAQARAQSGDVIGAEKLLPVRRALSQINILGPRKDVGESRQPVTSTPRAILLS
jgi:hypothetical protein